MWDYLWDWRLVMGRLTALKVKTAPPGRYGDGDGLYLVVTPTTDPQAPTRKWVLRVQHRGRRRDMGLGSARDVTLAEARAMATDARRKFKLGMDPIEERRQTMERAPTFQQAAETCFAEHKAGWKNDKHAAQWISTLRVYAFPTLGNLSVDQIGVREIRDTLAPIWLEIPETARRLRQRIGAVLDFAFAKGWRDSEAPLRAVSKGLPKQSQAVKHMAALPWQDLPAFIGSMPDTLKAGDTVRFALEFVILTAARSGEVRGATWSEIDFGAKLWTIPAERMKAGRIHCIPLSKRVRWRLANQFWTSYGEYRFKQGRWVVQGHGAG